MKSLGEVEFVRDRKPVSGCSKTWETCSDSGSIVMM